MCGIFGWCGAHQGSFETAAEQLSALLAHRGPDDAGLETGPGWGLGFRRLSILDLSPLGHQPMALADGRYWLIFNGEIYNYVELRQALEQQGERFRGGSDTEVLLRLLARDGAAALGALNGMFAFCFIDLERRRFILARDRLGVKPLYYTLVGGQLRFASELKALLAWPDAPRRLDHAALAQYLALNYLPAESAIFEGYAKLPPGHVLEGSLDQPAQATPRGYWQLEMSGEAGAGSLSAGQEQELLDLLRDAVRIRLRSDVPVGVFLSGGVDSGLIAALAAQESGANRPLALTVGFNEQDHDESALARATAEQIGLEHRLIMQPLTSLDEIDRLAWFFDEPFGDPSALPTFLLCEQAAAHATVFLSGDGGDEAFGGYRRYVKSLRYRGLSRLPALAGSGLAGLARLLPRPSSLRFRLVKSSLPDHGFAAVFDTLPLDPALELIAPPSVRALLPAAGQPVWERWRRSAGKALTARQQLLDYQLYLPDDILVKVDRASMAHSIEVRSPFLDYRLVEWAARLPRAALLNAELGKLPLRALGSSLLPAQVQQGPKRPFGVPFDAWFRQPAGLAFVRERLLSDEARRRGLWDLAGVEQIIASHVSGQSRQFGFLLWRLLMLDAWARLYLDSMEFLQRPPAPARRVA